MRPGFRFPSKLNRATLIVACFLSSSLGAIAEEGKARNPAESPASAAENVARGRSLYAHHCSHCHGFNMVSSGTVAYDLRRFPQNDKARFVNSVSNGKGGMPPWKETLSAQQMDQLWAYVLTGGKP
jgi:mono/diheme cytochrome c family protein